MKIFFLFLLVSAAAAVSASTAVEASLKSSLTVKRKLLALRRDLFEKGYVDLEKVARQLQDGEYESDSLDAIDLIFTGDCLTSFGALIAKGNETSPEELATALNCVTQAIITGAETCLDDFPQTGPPLACAMRQTLREANISEIFAEDVASGDEPSCESVGEVTDTAVLGGVVQGQTALSESVCRSTFGENGVPKVAACFAGFDVDEVKEAVEKTDGIVQADGCAIAGFLLDILDGLVNVQEGEQEVAITQLSVNNIRKAVRSCDDEHQLGLEDSLEALGVTFYNAAGISKVYSGILAIVVVFTAFLV